jgi:tRNA (guanine26-N2/guanine27-N2)-dimethyltransferase
MYKEISEGKTKIIVPQEEKISKKLPVFYNPVMEYNRTISVVLINALNKKNMEIALPLAGTGVRAIRLIKETKKDIIDKIHINDYDKTTIKIIKKNLKNNITDEYIKSKTKITCLDANLFLISNRGFDYIDIDPFGSPNPFLSNAISRLKRDSILAVTATDTGALCGTYKNACIRKYWAIPLHSEEMHEVGLRILIRKIQLIGIQFDKALIPILSYDKDHYMRVFFLCKKSKTECDKITKLHQYYKNSGPMWIGQLKDKKLVNKIKFDEPFIKTIKNELDILGFYEIPSIYKKEKISIGKKITEIIKIIKSKGFKASRTHFSGQGIKSTISYEELIKILK